jgi:hypothetical protein
MPPSVPGATLVISDHGAGALHGVVNLDPSLLDARPPEYDDTGELEVVHAETSTYSAGKADEVEARLRGLGYLE